MKKRIWTSVLLVLLVLASSSSLFARQAAAGVESALAPGRVVVANRGSGSISVIDARTNALIDTIPLPAGPNAPEPMYVVYSAAGNRVFVGDRANDRVVVYRVADLSLETTVPAARGVFHMWANPLGRQLWVNGDIDNVTTVIDPKTLATIASVPTPADLVAQGGFPHDVILDPIGPFAYVTVLGLPGENDYVVKYNTITFNEVDRAAVGKDPHLSLTWRNNFIYVPSQGSDVVTVLDRRTLDVVTDIPVPGAHGAGMPLSGRYFYTTNLPGGGTDGLFVIDTRSNTVAGDPVDTPYPVPHNIALNPLGNKLFLTHSGGTADKVTIYRTRFNDPTPILIGEVTVGLNPFGLAFVP